MAEAASRSQVIVARVAVAAIAVLLALALLLYGFSAEIHRRLWQDIFDRPGGPMSLRGPSWRTARLWSVRRSS
jgi:hypothetical protein